MDPSLLTPTTYPGFATYTIDGSTVTIDNGIPVYNYPTRHAEDARTKCVRRAHPGCKQSQGEYGELLAKLVKATREGFEPSPQYRRDVMACLMGIAMDVAARRALDDKVAALVASLREPVAA